MKAVLKNLEGYEKAWEVPNPPPPELRVPEYEALNSVKAGEPLDVEFKETLYTLEYVIPSGEEGGGAPPLAVYHERDSHIPTSPKASIKLYEDAVAKVLTAHPDLAQHQSKIIKLSESFPMKHEESETPVEYLQRLYEIAKTDVIKLGMEEEKLKEKLVEQQKKIDETEKKIQEAEKLQKQQNKFIIPADFVISSQALSISSQALSVKDFGVVTPVGSLLPIVQPKFLPPEPPEPPKPKEPPEVEAPKGRLINLKKKG